MFAFSVNLRKSLSMRISESTIVSLQELPSKNVVKNGYSIFESSLDNARVGFSFQVNVHVFFRVLIQKQYHH